MLPLELLLGKTLEVPAFMAFVPCDDCPRTHCPHLDGKKLYLLKGYSTGYPVQNIPSLSFGSVCHNTACSIVLTVVAVAVNSGWMNKAVNILDVQWQEQHILAGRSVQIVLRKDLLYRPDMITLTWRPFTLQTIFFHTKSLEWLASKWEWLARTPACTGVAGNCDVFLPRVLKVPTQTSGNCGPNCQTTLHSAIARCHQYSSPALSTNLCFKLPRQEARKIGPLDNGSDTTVKHLKQHPRTSS